MLKNEVQLPLHDSIIWYLIAVNLEHSHKKREDSLETRVEPVVLRIYVEN